MIKKKIGLPEKFFLNLKKQENYWILRAEEEEIIVGTNIIVNVHTEVLQTFSTYSKNTDISFPVFFLLTTLDKSKELRGEFEKRQLAVKKIDKELLNSSVEGITEILDQFVEENFK